jgi:predicted ATPase/class 3 adenylate cyclase/DNA-binding CsgD family transcriptional regulator
MRELPTGTVTFLSTDVEGGLRLWECSPDQARRALARHDELIQSQVDQHNGMLVRRLREADSRLAVFSRASDAIDAACAIQQDFYREEWSTPAPLRVRIALDTGEADQREGDYEGRTFNHCASLRAIGHVGQSVLSAATAAVARSALPRDVRLRDLGEYRLKGLPEPEHVFQLCHADLPAKFPPLSWREASPNNLPVQLTSFVGRENEIAELKQLLGSARLLVLTGAGGCGKTRLGLHVAAEMLESYPDGVWLAELAPLSMSELVPQTVAIAVGVREEPGQPITSTLISALRSKQLLLLMDNCEHLLASCAQLADTLIRSCPNLRIMATSRQVLGTNGETTLRVPPLSVVDPNHLPSLDVLRQCEAVQLFIERAASAHSGFAITKQNAPAVAQICYRLDGIPLAIELAAARIRMLSPEEIVERLDDRFRLLTRGSRTALPRQQTLRALVDWSYDLLSEQERALFRRLSVFAGGWTLEAAETVCAAEPIQKDDVLDLLAALLDKSLVQADRQTGGTIRYRLLETLRQYAATKLDAAEERPAQELRHSLYYVGLAERSQHALMSAEQLAALHLLRIEHDNFRAVMQKGIHRDHADSRSQAMRVAAALSLFWYLANYLTEGRDWLTALQPVGDEIAEPAAIMVESWAGFLTWWLGNLSESNRLLDGAVSDARGLGDDVQLLHCQFVAWIVALMQGEYQRILEETPSGVDRARERGDVWYVALGEVGIGAARVITGQADGEVLLQQGIVDAGGERYLTGFALVHLGLAAAKQDRFDDARHYLETSLQMYRELGAYSPMCNALGRLGSLALQRAELAQATHWYAETLRVAQQVGRRQGVSEGLAGMGWIAARLDDGPRAVRLLGACAELRQAIGFHPAPGDAAAEDELLGKLKAELGRQRYGDAWSDGQRMNLDDAIGLALTPMSPTPGPPTRQPAPVSQQMAVAAAGSLTRREVDVLRLVAAGKTNREIAADLVLSENTVARHMANIFNKAGLSTRSAAAAFALRAGLA